MEVDARRFCSSLTSDRERGELSKRLASVGIGGATDDILRVERIDIGDDDRVVARIKVFWNEKERWLEIKANDWATNSERVSFGDDQFQITYETDKSAKELQWTNVQKLRKALSSKAGGGGGGGSEKKKRKEMRRMATEIINHLVILKKIYVAMELLQTLGDSKDGMCTGCSCPLPCANGNCRYHASALGSKFPILHIARPVGPRTSPHHHHHHHQHRRESHEPEIVIDDDDDDDDNDGGDEEEGEDEGGWDDSQASEGDESSREYASSEDGPDARSTDYWSSQDEYFEYKEDCSTDDGEEPDYKPTRSLLKSIKAEKEEEEENTKKGATTRKRTRSERRRYGEEEEDDIELVVDKRQRKRSSSSKPIELEEEEEEDAF